MKQTRGEQDLTWWHQRLHDPCFVYVIQGDPYHPIKVGTARDVIARMGALQTGCWQTFHLLYVVPGGHELESRFHRRLKHYRLHGEWFDGDGIPPFLHFVDGFSDKMRDAYKPASGIAPHHTEVDPVSYGTVRRIKKVAPVTVRRVDPESLRAA